jgi:hypothetical protein
VSRHDDLPAQDHPRQMRASGVRDVLIYCKDHRCSHSTTISADQWPDNVRLSDIEPDFVCTACGKARRGCQADVSAGSHGDRLIERHLIRTAIQAKLSQGQDHRASDPPSTWWSCER